MAHTQQVDGACYQGSEETEFSGPKKYNGTRTFYIHIEENLFDLFCGVSHGSLNIYWCLTLRILVAASRNTRFNIQKFYFPPTEFIYVYYVSHKSDYFPIKT